MPLSVISLSQLPNFFGKKVKPVLPKNIAIKDGYLTSPLEYKALAILCKIKNPKKIFEIGTFEGYSTLILAMNSPQAMVYTLDLPQDNKKTKFQVGKHNERYINTQGKKKFLNTIFLSHIKQLYGDSALLRTSSFKQKMDFVFIDGAHTYEYTKNDTKKALAMIHKGSIIVWHDYNSSYWPETLAFLNDFSKTHKLYHIKNTYLVFFVK